MAEWILDKKLVTEARCVWAQAQLSIDEAKIAQLMSIKVNLFEDGGVLAPISCRHQAVSLSRAFLVTQREAKNLQSGIPRVCM